MRVGARLGYHIIKLCTRGTIFTTATRKVCNYLPMNKINFGLADRLRCISWRYGGFRKPVEMKRKVVATPGSAGLLAQFLLVRWQNALCRWPTLFHVPLRVNDPRSVPREGYCSLFRVSVQGLRLRRADE